MQFLGAVLLIVFIGLVSVSIRKMTAVSGLTGSPSRCCFQIPVRSSGSLCGRVSNFPHSWKPVGKNEPLRGERYSSSCSIGYRIQYSGCNVVYLCFLLQSNRSYWTGFTQRLNARKTHLLKFAMDASYGDVPNEPTGKFHLIVLGAVVFFFNFFSVSILLYIYLI